MKCPNCKRDTAEVLDSRKIQKYHGSVRRRRVCSFCYHGWTTYEIQQKYIDNLFERDQNFLRSIQELYEQTQRTSNLLTRNFGSDLTDPASSNRGSL